MGHGDKSLDICQKSASPPRQEHGLECLQAALPAYMHNLLQYCNALCARGCLTYH